MMERIRLRVLVIAPEDPNLPDVDIEILAIKQLHEVVLVSGTVREVDIADAIRREEPFDVIWWVAHGGAEGIQLSDRAVLKIDGVTQYVTASHARLCVLNSCSSEDSARRIVVGGTAAIIYTITNLVNEDALRFGPLLAKALSETTDFHLAFINAKPTKGEYRFLDAGVVLRAMDLTTSGRLDKLSDRQEQNVAAIYLLQADSRINAQAIASLRADLTTQQAAMERIRGGTEGERTLRLWLAFVSVIQVLSFLGLFYLLIVQLSK